ncbi:MAG: hypothetical protein AAF590_00290 [Pseudomonadota bacterium]
MSMEPSADSDKRSGNATGSDLVLGGLFAALIFGSGAALFFDFQSLVQQQQAFERGLPNRTSGAPQFAPGDLPGNDDQVRRYDPRANPGRGNTEPVILPGFEGDPAIAIGASITFHVGPNGTATAIGRIDPGSFVAFEEFIDSNPQLSTVTFQSPGGSVRDAIAMAELIRERQIDTAVARHGYCASSCPLAFSGGVERGAGDSVSLGVHQVFTSDAQIGTLQDGMEGAQFISSLAQQTLVDMGVDPRAWIFAMATPRDQLYVFNQEELVDLNWVTD